MSAKDYSTISPSALSLLLMKGYTNIPYARETAALMQGPEVFDLDFNNKDFWFWIRVMHFEARYWSIDQLLQQSGCTNVLELSSGYSLRGLHLCTTNKDIHYIDTDLPIVVDEKRKLMQQLQLAGRKEGHLQTVALNALDAAAFASLVEGFANGPLAIINEGLLMYLNEEEKIRLCKIIHSALLQRGGYWITADIYVKRSETMRAALPQSNSEAAFMEQHQIEQNKFESYPAALDFFRQQGFELVQEAETNYETLSVMPHLLQVLPPEVRNSKEPPPRVQATWMLRAV